MIQHAIAVMLGITVLTPIKACWVAITLVNVMLMWALFIKSRGFAFPCYLISMSFTTLLQAQKGWDVWGEAGLAGWSAIWVWTLLPRERHGRMFALSIGIVATFALMLAVPPPWRGYPADLYFTRLYSTAALLGIAFGSALLTRNPSTMLAAPWFMAVLIAGSQRGWDRWWVGIYTNLIWSACLICWLAISRRKDESVDVGGSVADSGLRQEGIEHPRYE